MKRMLTKRRRIVMTKQKCLAVLLLLAIPGAAAAGDYDFYAGTKYPGPAPRSDDDCQR